MNKNIEYSLLNNFLKFQLPGTKKGKLISPSIMTYVGEDKVFVIGFGESDGIITEDMRENLSKRLKKVFKKIYFFSLFRNNESFQELSERIAWGSYVWIATQPKHTIHFDNHPKLKARNS